MQNKVSKVTQNDVKSQKKKPALIHMKSNCTRLCLANVLLMIRLCKL